MEIISSGWFAIGVISIIFLTIFWLAKKGRETRLKETESNKDIGAIKETKKGNNYEMAWVFACIFVAVFIVNLAELTGWSRTATMAASPVVGILIAYLLRLRKRDTGKVSSNSRQD